MKHSLDYSARSLDVVVMADSIFVRHARLLCAVFIWRRPLKLVDCHANGVVCLCFFNLRRSQFQLTRRYHIRNVFFYYVLLEDDIVAMVRNDSLDELLEHLTKTGSLADDLKKHQDGNDVKDNDVIRTLL